MTDETREPGWYWIRMIPDGPWHPYRWYQSRDGEGPFWSGIGVGKEPAEIGPRIPDPATLQQPTRTSEYLEVDAATAIKQVTLRVSGKDRPKANAFRSADRDEDGAYTPTVERLVAENLDPLEHLLAKIDSKNGGVLRLLGAVTDPRHREAFVLSKLYNWPLKDGPPGVPTLCSKFKKSDRQIRAWINTAIDQMRAAHGADP